MLSKELKLNIQPEDIDKAHRIGPALGDERNIIIEFTKDSTASHIYQSRGKLKDSRSNQRGVKIRTSLTKILGITKHFEYSKLSQLFQSQRENSSGSDIDEF